MTKSRSHASPSSAALLITQRHALEAASAARERLRPPYAWWREFVCGGPAGRQGALRDGERVDGLVRRSGSNSLISDDRTAMF
jgi:hypothetical protein